MIKTVDASEAKALIAAGGRVVEWFVSDGAKMCRVLTNDVSRETLPEPAPEMVPVVEEDATEAGEDEPETDENAA